MARKTPSPTRPDVAPTGADDDAQLNAGSARGGSTPPPPASQSRFFSWLRSTGISRQPGWIGGVCVGIATRLGIDPIIVRGIFVVAAVLGGPAILLYAFAWLLLPDSSETSEDTGTPSGRGKIHLEEVFHGHFESPVAGVLGLFALSMLPVTQGFWFLGTSFWGDPILPSSIGRALWTITVLGLLTWFIVWVARRGSIGQRSAGPGHAPQGNSMQGNSMQSNSMQSNSMQGGAMPGETSQGSATPGSGMQGSTTPGSAGHPRLTTSATASASAPAFVAPPMLPEPNTPPAPGAPEADFAAWRDQQQRWKAQNDDFRRQSDEANLRAQAEYRQQRMDAAALVAERNRTWRAANPRLRGSVIAIVVGIAAIAGAIASQSFSGSPVVVGLAVATVIVGFAIIVAGTFRRRSGFLSFIAVVLVACTAAGAFVPADRRLIFDRSIDIGTSEKYAMLSGTVWLSPWDDADSGDGAPTGIVIDLWHGTGETSIEIPRGATVRVIADVRSGMVLHDSYDVGTIDPALKNDFNEDSLANEDDDMNGDGVVNSDDNVSIDSTTTEITPTEWRNNAEDSYDFTVGNAATPTITIRLWQGVGDVWIYDAYPDQNGQ